MSDDTETPDEPEKTPDEVRAEFLHDLCLNLGYAHNAVYDPDLSQTFVLASKYRAELEVVPSSQDTLDAERMRTHLLIVNPQRDFACTGGALSGGEEAVASSVVITKFIYSNVEGITRITPTLTNHFPFQIMFAPFWIGQDDELPEELTEITAESIEEGKWKPNPAMASWMCQNEYDWLVEQSKHYCEKLEESDRTLVIAPYHCLHGSSGYSIVGTIDEARMFHSWVRSMQAECEVNGSNPLAENYSFFGPDVVERKDGEGAVGWKNIPALASAVMTDNLVLAGHFRVADTARDILLALGDKPSEWPCRLFYLKGGVVEEGEMPEQFIAIESMDDIPPLETEEEDDAADDSE